MRLGYIFEHAHQAVFLETTIRENGLLQMAWYPVHVHFSPYGEICVERGWAFARYFMVFGQTGLSDSSELLRARQEAISQQWKKNMEKVHVTEMALITSFFVFPTLPGQLHEKYDQDEKLIEM